MVIYLKKKKKANVLELYSYAIKKKLSIAELYEKQEYKEGGQEAS